LSKTRRERVRQLCRRQFDTGRAEVRTVQSAQDLQPSFEVLCDLHSRRRRSLGGKNRFACHRFRAFLGEAAERFWRLGRLRLQQVLLEGRPVAAELDLVGGDTMYFYQSGIDPDVASERPGWLSTIAALRRAMDEGCQAFDFLRGNEEYKAHWRAKQRPLCEVRVVPRTISARLRDHAWYSKEQGKAWIKRGLKQTGWRP
jgi:CelD/BcsL family acetyltransferase involved in cellulose biosynthesis